MTMRSPLMRRPWLQASEGKSFQLLAHLITALTRKGQIFGGAGADLGVGGLRRPLEPEDGPLEAGHVRRHVLAAQQAEFQETPVQGRLGRALPVGELEAP